jgi:hypothetical protein
VSKKHPFTARITTADDSVLPSEFTTPRSLAELFEKYQLKAVALNSRGLLKSNGVKIWWVSLSTVESLNSFTAELDGSTLCGNQLVVESAINFV